MWNAFGLTRTIASLTLVAMLAFTPSLAEARGRGGIGRHGGIHHRGGGRGHHHHGFRRPSMHHGIGPSVVRPVVVRRSLPVVIPTTTVVVDPYLDCIE